MIHGSLRTKRNCRTKITSGEHAHLCKACTSLTTSQVKRNVELELEAVHALQEQGVPIQHVNNEEEDGNGSGDGDEVQSDTTTRVCGSWNY